MLVFTFQSLYLYLSIVHYPLEALTVQNELVGHPGQRRFSFEIVYIKQMKLSFGLLELKIMTVAR